MQVMLSKLEKLAQPLDKIKLIRVIGQIESNNPACIKSLLDYVDSDDENLRVEALTSLGWIEPYSEEVTSNLIKLFSNAILTFNEDRIESIMYYCVKPSLII